MLELFLYKNWNNIEKNGILWYKLNRFYYGEKTWKN